MLHIPRKVILLSIVLMCTFPFALLISLVLFVQKCNGAVFSWYWVGLPVGVYGFRRMFGWAALFAWAGMVLLNAAHILRF